MFFLVIFFDLLDCNYKSKPCILLRLYPGPTPCKFLVIFKRCNFNFNSSIKIYLFNFFFLFFFQLNTWQLHYKTLDLKEIITLVESPLLRSTNMTPPIHMGYAKPNSERFELGAWSLTPYNFLYKLYALKIIVFINT